MSRRLLLWRECRREALPAPAGRPHRGLRPRCKQAARRLQAASCCQGRPAAFPLPAARERRREEASQRELGGPISPSWLFARFEVGGCPISVQDLSISLRSKATLSRNKSRNPQIRWGIPRRAPPCSASSPERAQRASRTTPRCVYNKQPPTGWGTPRASPSG